MLDNSFIADLRDKTPCVYIGERGDVLTTGCYVSRGDDTNVQVQLKHEICKVENEKSEDIFIVNQVDRWDVCVKGRFTPIGHVYALAMLDPDWRP